MPTISTDDIKRLSRLARLDLTAEEEERFAGQLSSVVDYVEQLSKLDTSAVKQVRGVSGLSNVLGADVEREAHDLLAVPSSDLLGGVPVVRQGAIRVRAVLTEGS